MEFSLFLQSEENNSLQSQNGVGKLERIEYNTLKLY